MLNETNSSKRILYQKNSMIFSALFERDTLVDLDLIDSSNLEIGTVVIGKVLVVKKEMKGAFVEIQRGINGFLPFEDILGHNYDSLEEKKLFDTLKPEQFITVQIKKDSHSNKPYELTTKISLNGLFSIVSDTSGGLQISKKITAEKKHQIIGYLKTKEEFQNFFLTEQFVMIRTNAEKAEMELIINELIELKSQLTQIRHSERARTPYSILYRPKSEWIRKIKFEIYYTGIELITDDSSLLAPLLEESMFPIKKVRVYDDPMISLPNLYGMEKELDTILAKKVWLKSGAYITIESTEAMVVIDVNSAKKNGKSSTNSYLLETNLEAAEEIIRQLRLRNLSGIVIIDFITLKTSKEKEVLIAKIKELCSNEKTIPVNFIDMTPLDLVELTRKRIKKPIIEYLKYDSTKKHEVRI